MNTQTKSTQLHKYTNKMLPLRKLLLSLIRVAASLNQRQSCSNILHRRISAFWNPKSLITQTIGYHFWADWVVSDGFPGELVIWRTWIKPIHTRVFQIQGCDGPPGELVTSRAWMEPIHTDHGGELVNWRCGIEPVHTDQGGRTGGCCSNTGRILGNSL